MKSKIIAALLACATNAVIAQKTYYLDENRIPTSQKNAKFIQTFNVSENKTTETIILKETEKVIESIEYLGSGAQNKHGQYKKFYENGVASKTGFYKNNKKVGQWHYFYDNEQLKARGSFRNDKKFGLWNYYYNDGTRRMVKIFEEDNEKTLQHWTKDGIPSLTNGSGWYSEFDNEKGISNHIDYKDSVMLRTFEILTSSGDTTYMFTDVLPDYPGGLKKFYQSISRTLKYPKSARRAGIQGKVFVQFTVTKKGDIINVSTLKSLSHDCDSAAEQAIRNTSGKWKSGQYNEKNVNVQMILPITFRLN